MQVRVAIRAEPWNVIPLIIIETNGLAAYRAVQGTKVAVASKRNPCRLESAGSPARQVEVKLQEFRYGQYERQDRKSCPEGEHKSHDEERPTPAPPASQVVLDRSGHGRHPEAPRRYSFRRNKMTSMQANAPSPTKSGSCLQASCRRAKA
jgi:hypothetical protein